MLRLSFLQWFIDEQVEEVALVSSILDKLKLIGENGHGVLLLDNELGRRKLEQVTISLLFRVSRVFH